MTNVYDVTFQKPALEARDMFVSLEKLAQKLVKSGRLRIDAYEKINFVRYPLDNSFVFISYRELHDEKLLPRTISIVGEEAISVLRKEISTNQPVPVKLEEKIARLLVQSAHPAILELALLEGIEIFVSYSHNISDLLDLQTFQIHGSNSGMQSLGQAESRVFVSCGADPFSDVKEYRENAKYALSRFLIIAAQELGHYADIMRDAQGKPYSRHSANLGGYRAKKNVREGRIRDLEWCKKTNRDLNKLGLVEVAKIDRSIDFYAKHRKYSLKYFSTILKLKLKTRAFYQAAKLNNINFVTLHSPKNIKIMLPDMKFNLHPKAPVYEHPNAAIEEAIVCIEALARVPQQVVKWGHKTTKYLYPRLYAIYYNELIPAVIKSVENLTGEKYFIEYKKPKKSLFGKLITRN